jgi:molecular chaperone HscA
MTREGYGLGVDLGTSNTVAIMRWPDGRTRPLLYDGAPLLPSGVFLDESGRLHVGRDAQRMAQLDPARFEPNPKRRIDEPTVLLGDREVPVVDLLAVVLGAVARAAVEAVGFLPPAVLTYPAAWGQRRRDTLAGAVSRAGWPPVRLVPEPVAAARYFTGVLRRPVPVGASLAVFDFGGGTLDIAVVRNEGTGFTVLGSGGVPDLGGLDIDAALVAHLGGVLAGALPAALNNPGTVTQRRDRRMFWDDVRGAKEMLSRATVAPVAVPGVETAVHLTREELERVASPLVRRGVYETAAVIGRCGLRPDQLAGLFLVGGSSRLPLVARMLHAELGLAPTVLEQPEVPVAEGALAELPVVAASVAPVSAVPISPGRPVSAMPVSGMPAAPASPPGSEPPGSEPPGSVPPGSEQPGSESTVRLPGAPTNAAAPTKAPTKAATKAPAAGRPWYRRRLAWIAGGAALALLALAATLVVILRSGEASPVSFTSLATVGKLPIGGDGYVSDEFTYVVGDRGYIAYATGKQLHVAALDMTTAKPLWKGDHAVGDADNWSWLYATPDGVFAGGERYGNSDRSRTVYALDPADGHRRWQVDLYSDDSLRYYDSVVVVASQHEYAARGYDIATGKVKWKIDYPKTQYGSANAAVFGVATKADLAGPARLDGGPAAPDPGDDHRLLLIGADKALRVYDVTTGKATGQRDAVGEARDTYLGYAGRLFAVTGDDPYRVVAYDLAKLDQQPRILYTAADKNRKVVRDGLSPCGDDRVCLLDSVSSDVKTTQVAAVDVGAGKQLWRRPAPGADTLTPMGDRILTTNVTGTPASRLYDADSRSVLKPEDQGGAAVRVNAASALVFSAQPSSSLADTGLVGVDAGAGGRTPLGTLTRSYGKTCSWNERAIVCAADKNFTVWRFAS